jgi:sulfoxide reductase heme-binding subunit YedZ
MLTLAITPLRQLTHKPVLVRFRRMLGLHILLRDAASHGLPGAGPSRLLGADSRIAKRPYITVGPAAWLLPVPLAITSTQAAIRRLAQLGAHKLVMPSAYRPCCTLVAGEVDVREPALTR